MRNGCAEPYVTDDDVRYIVDCICVKSYYLPQTRELLSNLQPQLKLQRICLL